MSSLPRTRMPPPSRPRARNPEAHGHHPHRARRPRRRHIPALGQRSRSCSALGHDRAALSAATSCCPTRHASRQAIIDVAGRVKPRRSVVAQGAPGRLTVSVIARNRGSQCGWNGGMAAALRKYPMFCTVFRRKFDGWRIRRLQITRLSHPGPDSTPPTDYAK